MRNSPEITEALEQVFEEMRKLSPDEFRAELARHSKGEFAQAMRETSEFLSTFKPSFKTRYRFYRHEAKRNVIMSTILAIISCKF